MVCAFRVPQTLLYLEMLTYEPLLMEKLKRGVHLEPGSQEEVEIRGCSVWAVEVRQLQHCIIRLWLPWIVLSTDS